MATVPGLWGVKISGSQFLSSAAAQKSGDTGLKLSETLEIDGEHRLGAFRKKLNSGVPKYWGSKVGVFAFLPFFQVPYLGCLNNFIRVFDVSRQDYSSSNFNW